MFGNPKKRRDVTMNESGVSSSALKRSFYLGIVIFAVFGILLLRILLIQTVDFEKYQEKVINQITTQSPVPADRGKIYDRNGNVLATNITTYRVFISPSGILSAQKEEGEDSKTQYAEIISYGLAQTLGVSYDDVYKQATEYTKYLDRTIKRKVPEETADAVRQFIEDYDLGTMVYLEAQSTRYYPGGTLGAHMIGFTSSDGIGLYGLEYQYDEYLKGIDGYYIMARDSYGNEMPYEYTSYIDAVSGYNLTTTIDTTIQNFLEEQLEVAVTESKAENRACGVVMNVKTGAVLAMATSSPFDLNDPWTLDALSSEELRNSGYSTESQEYSDLSRELLTTMWSNKAITESYIPGSTFKIITSSMALEEKLVSLNETLSCRGSLTVSGIRIKCHKVEGHGPLTYPEGLQQSCNVWFMTLGGRIGIENYQKYVRDFGYYEKTGIDLPGEGNSIFASEMTNLDLAIYAFGQNFNVTPMQQICAVAAVANGGNLVTPYIVESISDNAGNTIYRHETEVKRQVLSKEVCETLATVLEEGVSGNGGAKNAYVAGYRVAAKTGTSEKKTDGDVGKYICSCVAFAPADDPEIAMIIIVDEPTKGALYGSTVAAPYISAALENILPYYGVEPVYTEEEIQNTAIRVANYKGYSLSYAESLIEKTGLKVKVVGSGSKVTSQLPAAGSEIDRSSGVIVLYMGDKPTEEIIVPDLVGKTSVAANQILINLGLNIKIEGVNNPYVSEGNVPSVFSQSIAPGTKVAAGSVVTVEFRYTDADEDPHYRG
ncbi:MAG: PASTA domain-containing protein [Ruminococcaceae bacterium]|nr:PASTA domain-containing protein [Oscillospiraceae bacterium]